MNAGSALRPARRLRAATGVLLALALLVVVGAVVVNGALLGVGLAAKTASDRFLALPSELRAPALPQRTVIVDAEGGPIGWLWEEDRQVVPLDRIAPVMRQALVDVEDSRFYENPGVDARAVARALVRDQVAKVSGDEDEQEGASTLTQQYVKNLRLATARGKGEREEAVEHSYTRKIEEARYALRLGETMSKDAILEGYLNLVFFGNGAYGVQAAAERYFDVDAADLTLPQAALLAGLVKNPSSLDPTENPRDARERRDLVLDRMLELGHVTPAQHAAAVAAPLRLRAGGPTAGCSGPRGYYCSYVLQALLADERFGEDERARERVLRTGGFRIVTTMDPQVQRAAERATARARDSRAHLAAAVVEPGTGKVLALAASRPFGVGDGATSVDLPLGGSTGFAAGSTFKVFVLAEALEQGIDLDLELDAPQVYRTTDRGKPYEVRNALDSESGRFTLQEATWLSVNTWYMQLQERTGVRGPAELAEAMGVRRVGGGPLHRVPSFTLGTNEVSPLAMAGAYATLAARGQFCPPHALVAVEQPRYAGEGGAPAPRVEREVAAPECRRVLPQRGRGHRHAGAARRDPAGHGDGGRPGAAGGGQDGHRAGLLVGVVHRLHARPGGGGVAGRPAGRLPLPAARRRDRR